VDSLRASGSTANGVGLLGDRSVAVVHEWFSAAGGSEKVFLAIADLIPHARRFALWQESDARRTDLHESWLARTPLRRNKVIALPLMPLAWRTLPRQRFDVVVSSSHAFAHTVRFGASEQTRYLSYVHSPARYVWSPEYDARGRGSVLAVPRQILKHVDRRLSSHVSSYAANSAEVRDRIKSYWRRDATVIHPPVDVAFFSDAPASERAQPRDYLLGVGRWIAYKNFPLMIEIASQAKVPLILAGSGPDEESLRRVASRSGVAVRFEVHPTRERLRELYWGARALLYPAHEDFGIVPVEAMACETPVIGLDRGGLRETVISDETGLLLPSLDPAEYAAAVARVDQLPRALIGTRAWAFGRKEFDQRMSDWIAESAA